MSMVLTYRNGKRITIETLTLTPTVTAILTVLTFSFGNGISTLLLVAP